MAVETSFPKPLAPETKEADSLGTMLDRPTDSKDADLLALRDRLRQARAERGACPPWEEIKADLVPGGSSREGRDVRQAHVALCPYCGEHVKEWRSSLDYDSDRLAAIEKGVAKGIVKSAQGFVRSFGPKSKPAPPQGELSAPPQAELEVEAAPSQKMYEPPTERAPEPEIQAPASPAPTAPPVRMYTPPVPERVAEVPPAPRTGEALARILVVEMADGRTPPQSVYLCAQVLEAEVAQVDSIEELKGDPDVGLVCGVVLGGLRNSATWPEAVRQARAIVPRRPVVLLATYGVEPPAGARRALGEALQSESDPAERLLLALAPELR